MPRKAASQKERERERERARTRARARASESEREISTLVHKQQRSLLWSCSLLGAHKHVHTAGAFPEIAMPQYPCDMGKKDGAKSSSTLATTLNAQGGINYDSILRQGKNRDKLIASDHSAMVPKVDKVAGGVRFQLGAAFR